MAVISNTSLTEGTHIPYVSIDEVLYSPTASAIDFSNLVANGSATVQRRALQELIVRASAMADNFVYGALGTLTATVETENGRTRANRQGQIIVHPYFWPILEVRTFKAGYGPGQGLSDVPVTNNNCSIERYQFIMTGSYSLGTTVTTLNTIGSTWSYSAPLFTEYTYVAGFANAFLTADAPAGSTTIQATTSIGIYPGLRLTIWDGMNDESVIVADNYNGTSLTIPLTAGTKYNHGTGTNVSNLPATVKQAVIHLVVSMVKQRGQGGLVLNELGEPTSVSGATVTSSADAMEAYDLLTEFRQIWGRN
jgi:hypothetical protein